MRLKYLVIQGVSKHLKMRSEVLMILIPKTVRAILKFNFRSFFICAKILNDIIIISKWHPILRITPTKIDTILKP